MGIFFLAMSIGQTVGPITSGRIADILTLDWAFYLMALAGLLGAVSFFWLTREKTMVKDENVQGLEEGAYR